MAKEIPLSKGKFAVVDDDDYDWLIRWRWFTHSNGYAVRNGKRAEGLFRKTVYMHRVISGAQPHQKVDHHDMDKRNNLRKNLRVCTQSENNANSLRRENNTSGYKGVTVGRKRRWIARITIGQKMYHLGVAPTAAEAAELYDFAAIMLFGEFARLNFPD